MTTLVCQSVKAELETGERGRREEEDARVRVVRRTTRWMREDMLLVGSMSWVGRWCGGGALRYVLRQ